ncbi:MAG: phosphoribosyltransferase family protein, partial [Terracidiphilus sp.]
LTLASGTLLRLRATDSQAGLNPRQRRLNVRGAFSVSNPAAVAGKHVLVIDDIFTTGATARAVAQALVKAGAESVWVATLARARRITAERRGFSPIFTDEATIRGLPGNLLSVSLHTESKHSSHDQPSF